MASTVVGNTAKLTRGVHIAIGALSSNTQVVQFNIPEPTRDNQGFVIIASSGTVSPATPPVLEGSIDGGNNWFVLSSSSTIVLNSAGTLNSDPAVANADAFQVNGMGGGVLFRYGYPTAATTVNVTVWACVG